MPKQEFEISVIGDPRDFPVEELEKEIADTISEDPEEDGIQVIVTETTSGS